MFEKILIPIVAQEDSRKSLRRANTLARHSNGTIFLLYIIDEDIFRTVRNSTSHVLGQSSLDALEDSLRSQLRAEAEKTIREQLRGFEDMEGRIETKIVAGTISEIILEFQKNHAIDLLILGGSSVFMDLDEIFHRSTCPIWIDEGGDIASILMISTNLAPNEKVPRIAREVKDIFNSRLKGLYVIDTTSVREVEVHENEVERFYQGLIDEKVIEGDDFSSLMSMGDISKKVMANARTEKPDLVILGRIRKPRKFPIYPEKSIPQKLANFLPYNLLLVN